MSETVSSGRRRRLRGKVVSDKMDKTVVVVVERFFKHLRYKKYIKRMKSFKAHDEAGTAKVDDLVIIEESRPMSRSKRWTVIERLGA